MVTSKFKVLAFDPGITTTGYALLECSTNGSDIVVLKLGEIHPGPVVDKKEFREEVEKYDKRTISLSYLREQIQKLLEKFKPDAVCTEDAFYNPRRPGAFAALCMWICTVRMVCRDYAGKYLVAIPTKTCKKEMTGVGGDSKLPVQQAVVSNKRIIFKDEMDKLHMSEHQADSIAVGVAFRNLFGPCAEERK